MYTLPAPAGAWQPNTAIKSAEVNSAMNDIASALTQSLATTGVASMTGIIKATTGGLSGPSYSFASAPTTGFYLAGTSQIGWSTNGAQGATFNSDLSVNWAGNQIIAGTLSVSGTTSFATLNLTGALTVSADASFTSTGFLQLPVGTTAQRPAVPSPGQIRYNSTAGILEVWNGFEWLGEGGRNPRGWIDGLTLSGAGTVVTVQAGSTRSDDDSVDINLPLWTKAIAGTFIAGSGNNGLDTNFVTTNLWIYVYAVYNPTTLANDIVLSNQSSSVLVTKPLGFTKIRYLGAVHTSAGTIQPFTQVGDFFRWTTLPLDVNTTLNAATTFALTVPTGFSVLAKLNVVVSNGTIAGVYIFNPNDTSAIAANAASPLGSAGQGTLNGSTSFNQVEVFTNNSGQFTAFASNNATAFRVTTVGWIDQRGKNA